MLRDSKYKICLIEGDFLEEDWTRGDIVFMNASCYDQELMEKVEAKAGLLKKGSILIVTTKKLESEKFKLLTSFRREMSWGKASVRIYQKTE